MEFSQCVVIDELTKIDRYAKGLPWEYSMSVKQVRTSKADVWTARSVEGMIKRRTSDKDKVGKKRESEGLLNSNKKRKFLQFGPNNRKYKDNGEDRWCNKCKVKHAGQCMEIVNCYTCGKTGQYAKKYKVDHKLCFECGKAKHFKDDCPKKKGAAKPNVLEAQAFQMILDAARDETDVI